MQNVLSLIGWSGSGKTTLLVALLPLFAAKGLHVSTVKHAHHTVDPDQPGKDSYRHRRAGATEVMLATRDRFVLFHEHRGAEEPDLAELISRMTPVDLILAEGFKNAVVPKLEVHRPVLGKAPLWRDHQDVIAVATDAALPDCPLIVLNLDDPATIAQFIMERFPLK
jgi:molybdopterin-guanine dinucleotide biosynthesis protein B